MRSFLIIVFYTIKQAVKKKSFWITNIIMAVLIALIFLALSKVKIPKFTSGPTSSSDSLLFSTSESLKPSTDKNSNNVLSDEDKSRLPKVMIVDSLGILGSHISMLGNIDYNFVINNSFSLDTIKKQVDEEELYSAVIINESSGLLSFDYIVKEDTNYNASDAMLIADLLKQVQNTKLLIESDVSQEDIQIINSQVSYNIEELNDNSILTNGMIVSLVLSFVLFFAIYFYSYSISASIASEKTSRVIESLVTSTTPAHIIIGKTIGMGILGLLQLIFLGLVCLFSYKSFISSNLSFLTDLMSSINLNNINIIILLIYFVLGYMLFAFLNSITGATVSKPEDIQVANLPISLISFIALLITFITVLVPDDDFNKFAAIFPLSSPFSMPGRILTMASNSAEIIVSLSLLLLIICFIAFIAIRIYSIAILHYGNRLRFRDLFKIFIKIK